jgi:hypothetical protein
MASIGEGPLIESEQFGLEQGLGDGGAVDRDKRSSRPGPLVVDGPGEQPFARARLTEDQDGRKSPRPGLAPEELGDLSPKGHQPRTITY